MTLDDYFGVGRLDTLGTHVFEPDEIKTFAAKYDPQPFHLDEAAAERSVFRRLCASGWHTAAIWMRLNLAARIDVVGGGWKGPGPEPVFGPSPGFRDLKWLKPVYAGEPITYTRIVTGHRAVSSRPGWRILTVRAEAFDSAGEKVLQFDSAVMVKVA